MNLSIPNEQRISLFGPQVSELMFYEKTSIVLISRFHIGFYGMRSFHANELDTKYAGSKRICFHT